MHPRVPRTAFFAVVVVLLAGLLAGCGGGGQPEGGSQDGESGGSGQQSGDGGSEQQSGEGTGSEESRQVKIALGTIGSVMPDENRFTLEPSTEEQGTEPITFRVAPGTRITVAGEQAELGDVEEGAQANVNYVAVNGKNRARSVEVLGE